MKLKLNPETLTDEQTKDLISLICNADPAQYPSVADGSLVVKLLEEDTA